MGKKSQVGKKRSRGDVLPMDMYDDADAFRREKELNFDDGDDDVEAESDDAQPVLGLDGSDYDSDDDLEAGGKLAKIVAAERAIKRQLALQRGEGDDDEDEEAEDVDTRKWGSRKDLYYNAEDVDVDFDSDDEAAAEEGEEAVRMQKEAAQQLLPQDMGLDEDDDGGGSGSGDESAEDGDGFVEDGTLGAAAKAKAAVRTERIQKEVSGMTDAEKLDAVSADAPELLSMLSDLKANILELRSRVAPLLQEVRKGGLATQEGISYLEAKHMLMLTYCMNIMFYLLLKLEGRPVRDHPVVARLVQIRAYLDKIRPIDKKLQHQIDKLLKAAEAAVNGGGVASDDPLSFRPNPDALIAKIDQEADQDGAQVYRPPKLNPVAMDDPDKESRLAKEKRRQKATLRRAQNNQYMREIEAELTGAPDEVRATVAGMDSLEAIKERQRLEARASAEEDLMIRVPLTKEERKRLKAQQRAGLSGRAVLDDFADDVAGLLNVDGGVGAADPFMARVRLNQRHGADLTSACRTMASADAELPRKGDLSERRAKYDAVKARQAMQLAAMEDDARATKRPRYEDEFYLEAKAQSEAKRKAKEARRAGPQSKPPAPDEVVAAPRKVNAAIEKNRGLTPHRRKDQKNPRVKARMKFAKAEVRRKGQVQSVKKQEGPYGGEATGIKSRVSKSVKLR